MVLIGSIGAVLWVFQSSFVVTWLADGNHRVCKVLGILVQASLEFPESMFYSAGRAFILASFRFHLTPILPQYNSNRLAMQATF